MEDKKVVFKNNNSNIDNGLSNYIEEISHIPLLSREEEKALAERIQKGDKEALRKLVRHNLRFVVGFARKYNKLGIPLMDLINEGNLGLIEAAKKFDPNRNVKFISYASWWVKQYIMKYLNEESTSIRIPIKAQSRLRKINKVRKNYLKEFYRSPNIKDISEISGMSEKEIKNAESSKLYFSSLDEKIGANEETTVMDLISDKDKDEENNQIQKMLIERIKQLIDGFSERDADILKLRYGLIDGERHTLKYIGDKYNISKEWVRQIINNLLKKIRKEINE